MARDGRLSPEDASIPERGSLRSHRQQLTEEGSNSVPTFVPEDGEWLEVEISDNATPPPVTQQLPVKDRLVVNGSVTHYSDSGGSPSIAATAFTRFLETTEEQSFIRRTTVGKNWQPLPEGWLKECGMLVVANEKARFSVQPTPEQRQEAEAKVLEVGIAVLNRVEPFAIVPSGETARFQPVDLSWLRLRCRNGEAKVTVYEFPK